MKRTAAIATFALSIALTLAGCAMEGGGTLDAASPGVRNAQGPRPEAAQAMVHAGETTAAVAAALGAANGYRFDSGYEVWVYRWPGADRSARGATELVILFGPDGTVRKTRIRPGATS